MFRHQIIKHNNNYYNPMSNKLKIPNLNLFSETPQVNGFKHENVFAMSFREQSSKVFFKPVARTLSNEFFFVLKSQAPLYSQPSFESSLELFDLSKVYPRFYRFCSKYLHNSFHLISRRNPSIQQTPRTPTTTVITMN
jgi:hypothetical protein